jgi:hypothetical protein
VVRIAHSTLGGEKRGSSVTAAERARVRDLVARKRIEVAKRPKYTTAQDEAGSQALRALKEATDRAQRAGTLELVPLRKKRRPRIKQRRCAYCGAFVRSALWPIVCYAHSDLPRIDPAYRAELELRGRAA